MNCLMLTDNNDFRTNYWHPDILNGYATIEDALAHYLYQMVEKMDSAIGINYAAAVVEEGSNLHVHSVFWSSKKATFDYIKKLYPGYRYDDCMKRLSATVDYIYKRNGNEDKGHTNRSQVITYGEYPDFIDVSVPTEWVNFIRAGHDYIDLINMYPSALGRAYGLNKYIEQQKEKNNG